MCSGVTAYPLWSSSICFRLRSLCSSSYSSAAECARMHEPTAHTPTAHARARTHARACTHARTHARTDAPTHGRLCMSACLRVCVRHAMYACAHLCASEHTRTHARTQTHTRFLLELIDLLVFSCSFFLAIIVDGYSKVIAAIEANDAENSLVVDLYDVVCGMIKQRHHGWPSPPNALQHILRGQGLEVDLWNQVPVSHLLV